VIRPCVATPSRSGRHAGAGRAVGQRAGTGLLNDSSLALNDSRHKYETAHDTAQSPEDDGGTDQALTAEASHRYAERPGPTESGCCGPRPWPPSRYPTCSTGSHGPDTSRRPAGEGNAVVMLARSVVPARPPSPRCARSAHTAETPRGHAVLARLTFRLVVAPLNLRLTSSGTAGAPLRGPKWCTWPFDIASGRPSRGCS
jgi:hypothetical protein